MATSAHASGGGQEWAERAACAGMGWEVFFRTDPSAATQVCASCPVRLECLQFALRHELDIGIWGGLTPRRRTRLRFSERVA